MELGEYDKKLGEVWSPRPTEKLCNVQATGGGRSRHGHKRIFIILIFTGKGT